MFRMLHAEGYKLKKSKSFYICSIIMLCFVILLFVMLYFADRIQKGNMENGTGGIVITANGTEVESGSVPVWDSVSLMELLQQIFAGSMLSCTIAIFVSIFVTGEYGSGMIKNVVGKGCSRASIYLSKLFMTECASVCIAFSGIISMLLFGRIFLGTHVFGGDFWHNFFIYTGIQLVIMVSMTALFMMVSEICRTIAGGISLNIGIILFSVLFINGMDVVLANSSFKPSDIWLIGQTERLPLEEFTSGLVIQDMLVAAVWFFAATLLGIWHFYKTDVK